MVRLGSTLLAFTIAAMGVALYFVGALVFHLRAKEYSLAPPVVPLVLAVVSLVLRHRHRLTATATA